jgi:hypothetical protein
MLQGTLADIKDQLCLGLGIHRRDRFKVATLKLLQFVSLCLSLRGLWLADRGRSLRRLHWPNRHGVLLRGFQGEAGFQGDYEA